jgi:hypothetical protein
MQAYRRLFLTPLALLCFFSLARADMAPETDITITTDDSPEISYLDVLRTDDGALKGISYRRQDGQIKTVLLSDLDKGDQLLKTMHGQQVVFLAKEDDLDPSKGGHVIVKFLFNGATGTYLDFRISLQVQKQVIFFSDPDNQDPHSDHSTYTSVFNHLFMKKRTVLGQEIGIQDVVPSWDYENPLSPHPR